VTRLLVIRFSALGDVAVAVPVVRSLAQRYPEVEITVLSRRQTEPLWRSMPPNVAFFGVDTKGVHHGIRGLERLLKELDYRRFDAVADLHNVLRSRWLDLRFRLAGKRVAVLCKGRWGKWRLVHHVSAGLPVLPSAAERYEQVFFRLGFPLSSLACHRSITGVSPEYHRMTEDFDVPFCADSQSVGKNIGIAPFAAHKGKIYPLDRMEEVVRLLARNMQQRGECVFLFGAGRKEKEVLEDWERRYPAVVSLAGKYTMDEEIRRMAGLRLMLTMDSANMHLASLAETRVLSIWGATHPAAGFLGFGQRLDDCIQRDLPCRPCSVYGSRSCRYRDYRCLDIPPQQVVSRILEVLEGEGATDNAASVPSDM